MQLIVPWCICLASSPPASFLADSAKEHVSFHHRRSLVLGSDSPAAADPYQVTVGSQAEERTLGAEAAYRAADQALGGIRAEAVAIDRRTFL